MTEETIFGRLDSQQLANEAWSSSVDIAEILRTKTLREIEHFLSCESVLEKTMIDSLMRLLPLDDFIENNARDFMNRYGIDSGHEVTEEMIDGCDISDHEFWYPVLAEQREIRVSASELMRLYPHYKRQFPNFDQEPDEKKRHLWKRESENRKDAVYEHAIRTVLSGRFSFQNLLERDRALDEVHHIIVDAKRKLNDSIALELKKMS